MDEQKMRRNGETREGRERNNVKRQVERRGKNEIRQTRTEAEFEETKKKKNALKMR